MLQPSKGLPEGEATQPSKLRGILFGTLACAYPALVYTAFRFGSPRIAALVFVVVALLLAGPRLKNARGKNLISALFPIALSITLAALTSLSGNRIFLLLSPSLVNASLLLSFAMTLRPGSVPMIERFARTMEGDGLSPAKQRHCRQFTYVWIAFFALNGVLALLSALYGSLEIWTGYNAGGAYLLMGALFATEWLVRRKRFGSNHSEN